jgi:ERCC4-type nuclease
MSANRSDIAAYILADHRENNGALPYLQAAADANNSSSGKLPWKSGGGNLMFQVLNNGAVGDYTIMLPSKHDTTKNIIAAVFERKTWKDLAASIKDQRSLHQHKSLIEFKQKQGCYVYYIIEGAIAYSDDTGIAHIPFKNLSAKMRSLSLRGYHSFQTKSPEHTAAFLTNLARDLAKLYRQDIISFPQQENISHTYATAILHEQLQSMLAKFTTAGGNDTIQAALKNVIDLVGGFIPAPTTDDEFDLVGFQVPDQPAPVKSAQQALVKAGSEETPTPEKPEKPEKPETPKIHIPEQLKTRSKASYTDVLMSMWCEIPKVTSKSAPILMSKMDIKDLLCCTAANKPKLRDTIANLTFTSGTKIGQAKAEAIVSVSCFGTAIELLAAQDVHVKILAQVPGVSQELAGKILNTVSMKTICETTKQADRYRNEDLQDQLAEIKRLNGNRKIGAAIAKKIIDIFTSEPDLSQLPDDV